MVDLFHSLSQTFKETINNVDSHSNIEVYSLIDGVINNTCTDCSNHEQCWKENYYTTYHKVFNLIALMESNLGNEDSLKTEIEEFCIGEGKLILNLKEAYQLFVNNEIWNKKLNEQRLLVADQLKGLGHVIEKISKDMYTNPIFNVELEQILLKELKNLRIGVQDITVAELEKDNIEILVDFNKEYNINENIERVRGIVSNSLGYPLSSNYIYSNDKNRSKTFKLIRSNTFQSLTKVCSTSNSEGYISGDNYTFGETDNISFVAISDGMGIGKKADVESSTAINLLEKLMEANFDKEMAIKTINSVLRTKSNDEIFTTMDMGFLDLYSGKLQMIKAGSPATFIKKKDRVEVVNSQCLPIGILKDIDFKIYEENLEDGDLIIMMSDGVLDSNRDVDNSEKWMEKVIMDIGAINPQFIADEILNIAHFMSGDKIKDDMTVMVTKVWKAI
jgi:stage II sporulation protein E